MRIKLPPEDLKELILIKFGSLDSFAKKSGLNNSQVSVGLKQQTARFMAVVKRLGVKVDASNGNNNKKESADDLKNQLKNCEERLASLETILKEKDKIIEHQNTMLQMMTQLIEDMKKNRK